MTLFRNNPWQHRALLAVAILLCAPDTVWAQSPWLEAITVLEDAFTRDYALDAARLKAPQDVVVERLTRYSGA